MKSAFFKWTELIAGDRAKPLPNFTSGPAVNLLHTTISQTLQWQTDTVSIIKQTQLRCSSSDSRENSKLPPTFPVQFYTTMLKSVLASLSTVWFGSWAAKEKAKLQHIISLAEMIIRRNQPPFAGAPYQQMQKKEPQSLSLMVRRIPANPIAQLLPSGVRYWSVKTRTLNAQKQTPPHRKCVCSMSEKDMHLPCSTKTCCNRLNTYLNLLAEHSTCIYIYKYSKAAIILKFETQKWFRLQVQPVMFPIPF